MAPFPLTASDGYRLGADLFEPPNPRAAVFIAPATGVKRRVYNALAKWLAERGFVTLTLDYRGIGESKPPKLRGFRASAEDWALLDQAAAIRALKSRYPALPLVVLGHSIGGQLLGMCPERGSVDGAVFIAVQSGHWRYWTGVGRILMFLNWLVMPVVTKLFGYLPMKSLAGGEDLPKDVALQWAAWGRHRDYVLSSPVAQRDRGHASVEIPIEGFAISDDGYAPQAAVEALLRYYERARKTLHIVGPRDVGGRKIGHFGAFRPEFKETLWPRFLRAVETVARR